jgi:hypothetical protein
MEAYCGAELIYRFFARPGEGPYRVTTASNFATKDVPPGSSTLAVWQEFRNPEAAGIAKTVPPGFVLRRVSN